MVTNEQTKEPLDKSGDIKVFSLWVGKIPWRRAWQSTPVFLPGEFPIDRGVWWAAVHGVTKSWI